MTELESTRARPAGVDHIGSTGQSGAVGIGALNRVLQAEVEIRLAVVVKETQEFETDDD